MNDNDEKMKEELEEFNEEAEKYNKMISGNEEQAEEIDENESEEEKKTNKEENELEELNEEIEKYNKMIGENEEQAEEIDENESEEEEEESSPSTEVQKSNKSKIFVICLVIAIILLVILTSIIGINKLKKSSNQFLKSTDEYSEEEKNIAGIIEKEKEQDSTKNIIKEVEKQEEEKKNNINNSKNYEKYQNLSEEEKKKAEVIPEKESKSIESIDDIKEEIDLINNLPSKYNLKDHIKLTVDDQKFYGLCWDFATLESMETNYQIKNKKEIDLSEISVDYLTSRKLFGYREPHDGGNFTYVLQEGSIKGVKEEGKNEYRDWNEKEIWSLLETKNNYYITDYVEFPSIYKNNGKTDISDEELQEFRKLVKSHIIQNGSLYAVFDGKIGSDKHAYRSENAFPSHAVAIVGWDDTYPKEKFTDLSHPEKNNHPIHDGAYIIKNSWGTNYGDKGYYYISYDDQLIESELRGVLSLDTNKKHYLDDLPNYLKEYIQEEDNYQVKRDKKGEYVFPTELKTIKFLIIEEADQISNEEFSEMIDLLPQLTYLDINNNSITDISSLTKLNNLASLSIRNGEAIQDYSVIGQIKSLKSLTLANTNLSDISFVSNLEKLNHLDLTNNHISDISALANLKINSLTLDSNNVTDISVLINKDQLNYLSLKNNPGVVGYSEFPNIYYINVSNCELSEIESIHMKKNIGISLSINNNHLTQLPYIESDTPIDPDEPLYYYSINAENNNIDSLSGLNKENVYYLNLAGNNFSDLSKLEDYYINSLNLSNNNIKDTSGFNNQNIKIMNLSNNKEIIISKELNSLNDITLNNCNIKSLKDLSMLDKLVSLSLNDNEISSLEGLDEFKHLRFLSLDNNQINSLENIKNSNIAQLYLENNKIESLSGIENIDKLDTLILNNNPIKEFTSLSKLKELYYLYLDNVGTIDASELSPGNDDLSISLQNNEIEGTLKSNWNIINLMGSTLKDVDINSVSFQNLNIKDTKGTVKYDKVISNIIKRGNNSFASITFNKNPISLDDIYEIENKKISFWISETTIMEKRKLKDNQYYIDDSKFRKVLVKSYTSSEINNGHWNENFTSLIPNNSEKDIIINLRYYTENNSSLSTELTITND